MTTLPTAPLLVVEDDELTRSFLVEHLAADGYDPLAAATLGEAIETLERASPCLVLSDLTLPDGSGLDLVARIRAADGIVSRVDPATPILLLTGRAGELDRVRGFERGCDDYLVKPFSYPELRGVVSSSGPLSELEPPEGPSAASQVFGRQIRFAAWLSSGRQPSQRPANDVGSVLRGRRRTAGAGETGETPTPKISVPSAPAATARY